MPEQPDHPAGNDFEELASRLREADHLEPGARAEVADLLGNLAAELDKSEPSAHKEHLAETAAQLVRAVKGTARTRADRRGPGTARGSRRQS